MNTQEKLEMLKETIRHLYSKEGRSFSYISRLLQINRKRVTEFIKANNFEAPKPERHLKPSNEKFLNAHREEIISMLDKDIDLTEIGRKFGKSKDSILCTFVKNDPQLRDAMDRKNARMHKRAEESRNAEVQDFEIRNLIEDIDGEEWKEILGYPNYFVSNKGRVKCYKRSYDRYSLLNLDFNELHGRFYVHLPNKDGERHTLQVSRLVGFAFVDGHSAERNTINHKDGNRTNNCADNLEWTSQGENNAHAYRELNRQKVTGKRYEFDRILYKDKYEFKTVSAFARFIGKSETQTRRYIDEPEKHDIKLIKF